MVTWRTMQIAKQITFLPATILTGGVLSTNLSSTSFAAGGLAIA
jgi:hypothetical protein